MKLPLWDFDTVRSGASTGVITVEELFPVRAAASLGLLTEAVLVTLGAAAAATRTGKTIEVETPVVAGRAVARVQTTRPPPTILSPANGVLAAQVQPAPTVGTAFRVKPDGRVSVTV